MNEQNLTQAAYQIPWPVLAVSLVILALLLVTFGGRG